MVKNAQAVQILVKVCACSDAILWAKQDGGTGKQLWARCNDASNLLWFAEKIGADRKLLVLAGCDCARTALKFVPEGEERPRKAIEAAEAYCRGDVGRS